MNDQNEKKNKISLKKKLAKKKYARQYYIRNQEKLKANVREYKLRIKLKRQLNLPEPHDPTENELELRKRTGGNFPKHPPENLNEIRIRATGDNCVSPTRHAEYQEDRIDERLVYQAKVDWDTLKKLAAIPPKPRWMGRGITGAGGTPTRGLRDKKLDG